MPDIDNTVPFTQYLRPNGRKIETAIEVSNEAAVAAGQLVDAGCRFESEVLTTGEVSLTAFNIHEDEDIAIEVVPNGQGMTAAVERLIEAAGKNM